MLVYIRQPCHGTIFLEGAFPVDEAEIAHTVHRCVDECGYSWATTCQIVSRMVGHQYTEEDLKKLY